MHQQAALSLLVLNEERKVRTPQDIIAASGRHFVIKKRGFRSRFRESGIGQVQQKASTGHAVVKPGKLYEVKRRVNQSLSAIRTI